MNTGLLAFFELNVSDVAEHLSERFAPLSRQLGDDPDQRAREHRRIDEIQEMLLAATAPLNPARSIRLH